MIRGSRQICNLGGQSRTKSINRLSQKPGKCRCKFYVQCIDAAEVVRDCSGTDSDLVGNLPLIELQLVFLRQVQLVGRLAFGEELRGSGGFLVIGRNDKPEVNRKRLPAGASLLTFRIPEVTFCLSIGLPEVNIWASSQRVLP